MLSKTFSKSVSKSRFLMPKRTFLKAAVTFSSAAFLSACISTQPSSISQTSPNGFMGNMPLLTEAKTSDYSLKSGGSPTANQLDLAIQHAELNFEIFPNEKSISARSVLTMTTNTARKLFSVDLDHLFDIQTVSVNGQRLNEDQFRNESGELIITTEQPIYGEFVVEIGYTGQPREAVQAPWDGGFDWKKTPQGKHWIATAVQGEGCDLFWPCIDQPYGEIPKMDIHITVPDDLVAASNGTLQGVKTNESNRTSTYHWQTQSLHNTYAIALNVGPYEVIRETYKSIYGNEFPMVFFHLDESAENAKVLFKEIAPMLDFFETVIGPYPFGNEKMGVVETSHLGMEHQTINAYGNKFKVDDLGYDWLLHHEFAHEWFGNQLTNTDWDHMWLHEGFGTYMQPLYSQYLHGDMAYKAHLFKQRKYLKNKFPIVANRSQTVAEVYDSVHGPGNDIYYKGSLILHSLRELVGDDVFFNSIRLLVYGTTNPTPGNFKPRFASTEDYIAIINRLSGQDLRWFFETYLFEADLPKLNIQQNESSMRFEWQTSAKTPFIMPIDVEVNGTLHTLDLSKPQVLNVQRKDVVIIDPESKVLRQREHLQRFQDYLKKSRDKNR
jgi:aminopeptidase N